MKLSIACDVAGKSAGKLCRPRPLFLRRKPSSFANQHRRDHVFLLLKVVLLRIINNWCYACT